MKKQQKFFHSPMAFSYKGGEFMQDIRAYRPRRSLRKLLYNDWKRHKWKYILVIPVILFFLLYSL